MIASGGRRGWVVPAIVIAIPLAAFLVSTRIGLIDSERLPDPVTKAPAVADVQSRYAPKSAEDDNFRFDMDRLYDLSYEVDPELVEFASSIDVVPSCLIRFIKAQKEKQPGPHCGRVQTADHSAHMLIPGVYETFCYSVGSDEVCRRVKTSDHPYESYSDAELIALSESSPEAAVILARRVSDPQESAEFYEKAVVLSGKPGPLEEWMYQKDKGGLEWRNGLLDVEKAKVGYGVYAITSRLGYGEKALQEYKHALVEAGVDTGELDYEAQEKFASSERAAQGPDGATLGGRIVKRLLLLLALLYCTAGQAQDADTACETDTGWIDIDWNTGAQGGYLCEGCRELNQFPEDFRNFATNFHLHGLGAARREQLEALLSAGDLTTNFGVCNMMGQCAQGSLTAHMDSVGLPVPEAQLNFNVDSYTIRITLRNGNQISATYPAGMVNQNTLPVPVTSEDDGVAPGVCLDAAGANADSVDAEGDATTTDEGSEDGASGAHAGGDGLGGDGLGGGFPPINPFGGGGGVTQPELDCWVFVTRENGVIVDVTIRCYPR